MSKEILVPQFVLLYAFRYAISRNTSAPRDIAEQLRKHWDILDKEIRQQVVEGIIYESKHQSIEASWLDLLAFALDVPKN